MNRLPLEIRAKLFHAMVLCMGIRNTARLFDVSTTTVMKFNVELGQFAERLLAHKFRNLKIDTIEADEIWAFIGTKEDHKKPEQPEGWGSVYTWTAIDPKTRLMPCWHVGGRAASDAYQFIQKLKYSITCEGKNLQIATDGNKTYLPAIEAIFGKDVNYMQFTKTFWGVGKDAPAYHRYSLPRLKAAKRRVRRGNPDASMSTNHIERSNYTIRSGMKRFTRMGEGYSKKFENHRLSFAMFMLHYNFCKVHTSLRVTPAMEAGLTDHIWTHEEVIAMMDRPQAWHQSAA